MIDEGNYSSAASLLHSLLWSKLAPKYFWVTLLIDAIPFLTADDLLFTSEQTYELLQCLQVGYYSKHFRPPHRCYSLLHCRRSALHL
jgi:Nup85 Nucleoporin